MANSHIDQYLEDYVKLAVSPQYAVMLIGEWGAGKSHYLEKLRKKLIDEQRQIIYISLYGLGTKQEVDAAIFAALHPLLSSSKMKLLGRVASGLLKTTVKIDISDDLSANASLPSVALPDYKPGDDQHIVIFDDFERCEIKPNERLGYINYFVEHLGLKVIIAANEDAIENSEDCKYLALKEKVVGATFKVETNFSAAYDAFLEQISPDSLVSQLRRQKEHIGDIFLQSTYNNLRSLRASLLSFQRIYAALPANAKVHEVFLSDLLQYFLPLSFEIRKGTLEPQAVKEFVGSWPSFIGGVGNKDQESDVEKLRKKYTKLSLSQLTEQQDEFWSCYFETGFVDAQLLFELVESNPNFLQANTPNWKKLWWWHRSAQEEFNSNLEAVQNDIKKKKYTDIYVVMHVFNTLLNLAAKGYIKRKSVDQIVRQAKQYIKQLGRQETFCERTGNGYSRLDFSGGHDGLGYTRDQPEFNQLVQFLTSIGNRQQTKVDKSLANELIALVATDRNNFSRQLADLNGVVSQIPVFSYISPSKFIKMTEAFVKSSDWDDIAWGFRERFKYGNSNSVDYYIAELTFFDQLSLLLDRKIQKAEGLIIQDGVKNFREVIQSVREKLHARKEELSAPMSN